MEKVEAPVGQNDQFALFPQLLRQKGKFLPGFDLCRRGIGHPVPCRRKLPPGQGRRADLAHHHAGGRVGHSGCAAQAGSGGQGQAAAHQYCPGTEAICKVASQDREVRQEAITALCEASGAELVQSIGKMAVILRRAKKPNPKLSNLQRHKH